ncbi:hypothetical protein BDQ17DRAFT_1230489 [Cyathus striatus]|nr:hypothetical protein BDQ17DRAFT_1230489 [Cyathus striatus]
MFEEVCLLCGKHLTEDGRAYCSDDCANTDTTSPSISSSSSALSSPHLGYTAGGDVPALIPSLLGSALKDCKGRSYYSSSSSCASWSVLTDDEEDAEYNGASSECSFNDGSESIYDGSSQSANYPYSLKPSALNYARRPSGTNNGSATYGHPSKHLCSDPSVPHSRGYPRSAPNHSRSSTEDESDFGSSSRDRFDTDDLELQSDDYEESCKPRSPATKARRNRNRASLPAYFSLLQMNSSTNEVRSSPLSSSSAQTVARLSPPTPKLANSSAFLQSGLSQAFSAASIIQTPLRGRRRVPGDSRSSRRSGSSHSRSHSRRPRHEHCLAAEEISESDIPSRGRTNVRRNSSPPPKMLLTDVSDRGRALLAVRQAAEIVVERSQSSGFKTRGRARLDELEGGPKDAPGFGNGRSGLVNRERERAMGLASVRIPL